MSDPAEPRTAAELTARRQLLVSLGVGVAGVLAICLGLIRGVADGYADVNAWEYHSATPSPSSASSTPLVELPTEAVTSEPSSASSATTQVANYQPPVFRPATTSLQSSATETTSEPTAPGAESTAVTEIPNDTEPATEEPPTVEDSD